MWISRRKWDRLLEDNLQLIDIVHKLAHNQFLFSQELPKMRKSIENLDAAISNLADAIAAEIGALQAAWTAVPSPPATPGVTQADIDAYESDVDDRITRLNNLTAELKNSVTGASGSPAQPVQPLSTPGNVATPDVLPVTPAATAPAPTATPDPLLGSVGQSFPIGNPDTTVDPNPTTPQSINHTGGPSENPSPGPTGTVTGL